MLHNNYIVVWAAAIVPMDIVYCNDYKVDL